MEIPKVSSFLYCMELETGGIVLGILGLILGVWEGASFGGHIILGLIFIVINGLWLWGIHEKRISFMLPVVIFDGVLLIWEYLSPFYIFLIVQIRPDSEIVTPLSESANVYSWFFLYIFSSFFGTYFWIVEYSLYKKFQNTIEKPVICEHIVIHDVHEKLPTPEEV